MSLSNKDGNANYEGQAETPAVVKRKQLGSMFMSPTDNMMSPCTQKLLMVKGHPAGNKLHRQMVHGMMQNKAPIPKLELDKEN